MPPPPLSAALDDLVAAQPVGVARGDACVATFLRAAVLASAERRGMVPPVSTWAEFRAATEGWFANSGFVPALPDTQFRDWFVSIRSSAGDGDPADVGRFYEAALCDGHRRNAGAHYTPRELTRSIVSRALADRDGAAPRVCDPACGCGAFLVEVARTLAKRGEVDVADVVRDCVFGVDLDPRAVEMTRLALWLLVGDVTLSPDSVAPNIRCGDALVGILRVEELAGLGTASTRPGERSLFKQVEACSAAIARGGSLVTWKASATCATTAAFSESHRVRPFHWPLEFPGVFPAGFDAVVMNPPFRGGLKTVTDHGEAYGAHLARVHPGLNKKTDLSAHFLRRAHEIVKPDGRIASIATTTLAQGRTRRGSLEWLLDHGRTLVCATSAMTWPGEASLQICVVHLGPSARGPIRLDGRDVTRINSRLRTGPEARPRPLRENRGLCFQGANFGGAPGFLVDDPTARAWIFADGRNTAVVRSYVTGDDLGRTPCVTPTKWCVQFGERSEADARAYVLPFQHVEERVLPARGSVDANRYPRMVKQWWRFWHGRRALYGHEHSDQRWLMRTRVTKTHQFTISPTHWVHSDGVLLFRLESESDFAVLQSSIHELWALEFASTLGAAPRYIAADCFTTFPRPLECGPDLARAGTEFRQQRERWIAKRRTGLTTFSAAFHDPDDVSPEIAAMRGALSDINRATAAAYSWHDLEDAAFHETRVGVRFTLSGRCWERTLARLCALNEDRDAVRPSRETPGGFPLLDRQAGEAHA
ncbi:MAG: N-6 DNA methylase [Planctomycetota bacterium]